MMSPVHCQIIEPHDKGISTSIKQHQAPHSFDLASLDSSPLLKKFDDAAYFEYIGSLCHYRYIDSSQA